MLSRLPMRDRTASQTAEPARRGHGALPEPGLSWIADLSQLSVLIRRYPDEARRMVDAAFSMTPPRPVNRFAASRWRGSRTA